MFQYIKPVKIFDQFVFLMFIQFDYIPCRKLIRVIL